MTHPTHDTSAVDLPGVTVWHGDCIDVMRRLPDNSIDVQRLTRDTPTPETVDDVELDQPVARASIAGDQPGLFDLDGGQI